MSRGESAEGDFVKLRRFEIVRKETMLWTLVAVFLILWLLGFSLSIGGGLIHLLLVIAVVLVVINLVTGRRVV
jgi:hypothetical protein